MQRVVWGIGCATLLFGGCSSPVAGVDAGALDASSVDAGSLDAPSVDAPAHDAQVVTDTMDARGCLGLPAFRAPTFVAGLNTSNDENGLRLSEDELDGYFTRRVGNGVFTGDILHAHRDSLASAFGTATAVPNVNDPSADDFAPVLSPTGLDLLFHRGDAVLRIAHRDTLAAEFGTPALVADVSTGAVEAWPTVSGLYFVGPGNVLQHASVSATGYATPTTFPELDAAGAWTRNPVLTRDELRIYFASQRTDGGALGGFDIWTATRATPSSPWTGLAPLGATVNTPDDEYPTWISPEGCRLYLAHVPTATSLGELMMAEAR